jgi:hypothetical protein
MATSLLRVRDDFDVRVRRILESMPEAERRDLRDALARGRNVCTLSWPLESQLTPVGRHLTHVACCVSKVENKLRYCCPSVDTREIVDCCVQMRNRAFSMATSADAEQAALFGAMVAEVCRTLYGQPLKE